MRVVLLRLDGGSHALVEGELRLAPERGTPVILAVGHNGREYVTTAVERTLRVVGSDRVYFETRNSTYRLEPGVEPRRRRQPA